MLNKLRAGKPAFSLKVNTRDSRVVEMMAIHGIDCIWTCTEHVANDWGVLEQQILAAKAYGAGTVAGIGNAKEYLDMGYHFLNLGSDMGALLGLMNSITDFLAKV